MMKKMFLVGFLASLSLIIFGCETGKKCGKGTTLEIDGACVALIEECGRGTVLLGTTCVAPDEDAIRKDELIKCKLNHLAGTLSERADNLSNDSESKCAAGTHKEGDVCVADIKGCGEGTYQSSFSIRCQPNIIGCAEGTELNDGVCVAKIKKCGEGTYHSTGSLRCVAIVKGCGEGTHKNSHGECVAD